MGIFRKRRKIDYWFAAYELQKVIPELKKVDSEYITDYLRGSNMEFYKIDKKKVPTYLRLTLPFAIIVTILALISIPFKFMITGTWGYKIDGWLYNWLKALRLAD